MEKPLSGGNEKRPAIKMALKFYIGSCQRRPSFWITQFDKSLDDSHEVGARVVNFGQAMQFYLTSIEHGDTTLMLFKGVTEDDLPVELIQHQSQISIMLIRLPRKNPTEPKRKIGFHQDGA